MSPDKPTYGELCDALVCATLALRSEAAVLREELMGPDGTFHHEDDRECVEEAFAEVDGFVEILRRAGREKDLCRGAWRPLRGTEGTEAGQSPGSGHWQMPAEPLTERERECLVLALEGCTAAEAAARLGLPVSTVDRHSAAARRKLGCANKLQAAVRAMCLGLL